MNLKGSVKLIVPLTGLFSEPFIKDLDLIWQVELDAAL